MNATATGTTAGFFGDYGSTSTSSTAAANAGGQGPGFFGDTSAQQQGALSSSGDASVSLQPNTDYSAITAIKTSNCLVGGCPQQVRICFAVSDCQQCAAYHVAQRPGETTSRGWDSMKRLPEWVGDRIADGEMICRSFT